MSKRSKKSIAKTVDIKGQRFGRLTVLSFSHLGKHNKAHWLCRCDCGTERTFVGSYLRNGDTKSCGCLFRETAIDKLPPARHGMSQTPLHRTWSSMLERCNNPNNNSYRHYGGRGITVCDEWHIFENFYADMGNRPKGYSLDRIDNNKGYYKENCRWATNLEQSNNKRTNVILTLGDKTQTITQWARDLNVDPTTLGWRLRLGWTVDETLTTPINKAIVLNYNGQNKTIQEWSKELKIKECTLYDRLEKGWSHEEVLSTPLRKQKNNKRI